MPPNFRSDGQRERQWQALIPLFLLSYLFVGGGNWRGMNLADGYT